MAGSKGYGTAKHRAGLGKWGSVGGHRTLFVRNWIPGGGSVAGGTEMARKSLAKPAAKPGEGAVALGGEGEDVGCLIKLGQ